MRALIVEFGEERSALTAARALGRAGWKVGIGSPRRGRLAGRSRWARWHHVTPAEGDVGAFVSSVNRALEDGRYEVVFAAGDAEVLALSAHRERIRAIFPYAEDEVVLAAFDKLRLFEAARRAGLVVPLTTGVEAPRVPVDDRPAIVKANLHAPGGSGSRRVEPKIVTEREEAVSAARTIESQGARPFMQELVEGDLMAYVAVADRRGRVLAELQQVAEAIYPPRAGISVKARTVPVDREISKRARKLLRALGWFGIAELQFVAPSGATPRLIDFNGRFYGSLALAVAAGLNLPHIWASEALGLAIQHPAQGRPGVRYHWLEGDLLRIRALGGDGRARHLLRASTYALGAEHSIWDWSDPVPALVHTSYLVGRRLGKDRT